MTKPMRKIQLLTIFIMLCAVAVTAQLAIDPIIRDRDDPSRREERSIPEPRPSRTDRFAGGEHRADRLTLADRFTIHGSLREIDPEEGTLLWEHPHALDPIPFALDGVYEVILGGRLLPRRVDDAVALRFVNGDLLFGRLIDISEDYVTVDTWYSGRLRIQKSSLSRISKRHMMAGLIYDGPDELSSWAKGGDDPDWRLIDGSLIAYTNTPLGREFDDMPRAYSVSCTMEYESGLQGYLTLNTEDVSRHDAEGSLILQLWYNRARLMRMGRSQRVVANRMQPQQDTQTTDYVQLTSVDFSGGSIDLELLVDRINSRVILLINGQKQAEWTEINMTGLNGKGIVFQPANQGLTRFRNIRVREWDGELASKIAPLPERDSVDMLQLINNDHMSGTLMSLREDTLQMKTSFGSMPVSMERVVEMTFAREGRQQPQSPRKGDVVVEFVVEGSLTLSDVRVKENEISGQSAYFGSFSAPRTAFRILRVIGNASGTDRTATDDAASVGIDMENDAVPDDIEIFY